MSYSPHDHRVLHAPFHRGVEAQLSMQQDPALCVMFFVVILSPRKSPSPSPLLSLLPIQKLVIETLCHPQGSFDDGLRNVVSSFCAGPAVSDTLWVRLGCVQPVELGPDPAASQTGSPGMQSQIFQDSTKTMRGWRKPKITVLFRSIEGDCLVSMLLCGDVSQAAERGVLGRAKHKAGSVPQLPRGGSAE